MNGQKPVRDLVSDSIANEAKGLGLYEVLDNDGDVLYVGAGPLQNMLSQHLQGGSFPIPGARFYRTFSIGGTMEVEERRKSLIEDYVDILGAPPKYNRTRIK